MSLEEYRYDIEMCLRCSSCKWIDPMWSKSKRFNKICPISSQYHFDSYSCQGLMDISLAILDGEIGYTETLADIVYHCTLCGACDVMCKRTLETERLLVLEELRQNLAEKGLAPKNTDSTLPKQIKETHNVWGAPEKNRFQWLDDDTRNSLAPNTRTAYFVGCTSAYKNPEIALATISLLKAAGVEFMILDKKEWCCGNPLFRTGFVDEAKKIMQHNLEAIQALGIETIVTSCAECYHTWKVDYPRQHDKKSLGYKVLHTTELIADRLEQEKFKFSTPVNKTVTYHDSCRLGRLSEPHEPWTGKRIEYGKFDPPRTWRRGTNGVYGAPRKILKAIPGLNFVEMERTRENTFCCGAGGAVKRIFNDFAVTTGTERITEAADTGAQILAASCPSCKWNFQDAVSQGGNKLEVMDIIEIAAAAV